jgi:hypothetical protein
MNLEDFPLYFNNDKDFIFNYLKDTLKCAMNIKGYDPNFIFDCIRIELMSKKPFFEVFSYKVLQKSEVKNIVKFSLFSDKFPPISFGNFPNLLPLVIYSISNKGFLIEQFEHYTKRTNFKHHFLQDKISGNYDPLIYLNIFEEVVKEVSLQKELFQGLE